MYLQVIKQATIACLSKYSIGKAHVEFSDLYQCTYRGVCCALVSINHVFDTQGLNPYLQRSIMRTQAVAMRTVDKLVQEHLRMYLKGNGEYQLK